MIGRGGRPAVSSKDEQPGPIQTHYVIPERLGGPGEHVLAIRTSAHHRHFAPITGYWSVVIGDYDTFVHMGKATTTVSLVSLSGMLMVSVFALLLFVVDRGDRSYLLLGLLGLVAAALLIAEGWRNLFGYAYNFHLVRLSAIAALSALLNLLLVLFVIERFPASRGRAYVFITLAGIALSLTAPGWDIKTLCMFITGLPLSLIWTLRAVARKRNGSLLAVAGLLAPFLALIWQPRLFSDLGLYISIDILLLCLLAAHVQQVRQARIEAEEARIKAARLEIELLKKHIQPHYLMNTLTAMAEWIEQQPQEAVKMIHALSDEFRILSEISHRKTIPLRDEIRLCRSYLEIMSRRKGHEYALTASGADPEFPVPPAVLHAIVENAVVHNRTSGGRMEIHLNAEGRNGYCRLTVTAPTCPHPGGAPGIRDGTGFHYIKARLQECYADDWSFHSGPDGNMWKTELRIPRSS